MRKLRILLLAAVLGAIALIGVRTAFAAASSGAEVSGKATPVQQQQQTPDRESDRDCPFKNRGGSEAEPSADV
jgi:hypothetical protein